MKKEFVASQKRKGMDLLVNSKKSSNSYEHRNALTSGGSLKLDISLNTIFLVLAIIAGIYLSSKILQILAILFFAFIISSSALPLIRKLMKRGLSKGLSIFIVYFLGIVVSVGILTLVIVPFISQFQNLISNLPEIFDNFVERLSHFQIAGRTLDTATLENILNNFVEWLTNTTSINGSEGFKSALGALTSVAGGIVAVITIVVISVYMVADHDNFLDLVLLRIIDEDKRKRVRQLVCDVEEKLGHWMVGQLTLCLITGFLSWLLLTIAQVPFALPLAVLAGLLESIPSLGPVFATVPAALFALVAGGPISGGIVLVGSVIIQQLGNTFIIPRVMSNAVGLKPVIVIIAVACGFILAGPIGALLSVPVAVLLEIFYQFYIDLQKLKAKGIV